MLIQNIDYLCQHPQVHAARLKPEWLYTCKRYPLYWHHIAKNGGTFFKNLLYVLDHDQPIERKSRTHDWDHHLVRASGVSKKAIRQSDYSLIVMRNPIHRFLSVYFDKVYEGDGPRRPGMSREFFARYDLAQDPGLSAAEHTDNCLKLAEWTALNIIGKTATKPNWHLVPQMHQLAQVHHLNFTVLTLEDFEWQLIHVLSPLIPEIESRIDMVGKSNKSKKPVAKSAILTPELKRRLKEIYQEDFRVFRQVRQHWRDVRAAEETTIKRLD